MTHDIWNPWHGCRKISPGCLNCYMYFLDSQWDKKGSEITRSKTNFNYPLKKSRDKTYKVQSGEQLRVCMTSDFFLEEADSWRAEAWAIMRQRPDVMFWLLTKRHQRIAQCLPPDWGSGYPNVWLGVTAENQEMADSRVPVLLTVPAAHRHICCAPLIGPVDLSPYLDKNLIHQVCAGGENYDGCRTCDYAWAWSLYWQCRNADIQYCFYETGTKFLYNGQQYWMPKKSIQSEQAYYLGLHYEPTAPVITDLRFPDGTPVPETVKKHPFLRKICRTCGSQYICNGCSDCGNCCCSDPY